ncbi:MAG: acyltransferase [Paludibacter sp.]|nr:acyltransferase [Paludibacter sp.]
MNFIDLTFKLIYRTRDIVFHYLRKPFIGQIGKNSYLKRGVKVVGNPYRIFIGHNFKIWENSVLALGKGKIVVGNNGLIGVGSFINAGNNIISIGNGVAIGPHVNILAYSHHYSNDKNIIDSYVSADIKIEDNVLIGAGVTILPGVVIGQGSIIGAGAVVNEDVSSDTVVGGIPAKVIKTII